MSDRLDRIVTASGDGGETSMADGQRVAKDSAEIHAQGDIDELNSVLGVLSTQVEGDHLELVRQIQHDLFDIGGELSLGQPVLKETSLKSLEHVIEQLNQGLPALREFILPGGHQAAAFCHLARSVCRRAERSYVTVARRRDLNPLSRVYLNRLSDFLFIFSRVLNDGDDVFWKSRRTT